VEIGAALVADDESSKAMNPGKRPFHHPSVASQACGGFDAAPGDARDNASLTARRPGRARIVRLVSMHLVRSEARISTRLLDGRDAVEQWLKQLGIGHIRAENLGERGARLFCAFAATTSRRSRVRIFACLRIARSSKFVEWKGDASSLSISTSRTRCHFRLTDTQASWCSASRTAPDTRKSISPSTAYFRSSAMATTQ